MAAASPPAFAQGGGQAPPGGTQTPPPVAPPLRVEAPGGKPLIREGQTDRKLLGGTWYFRQDDAFVGEQERWFDQDDLTGWSEVRVPHNWNARDTTENRPNVGWYRKEFTLPRSPKKARHFWKVRFEGANYRTKVWLNGEELAFFTGYFPFEVLLKNLRKGRNTLVAEVSSLRSNTDLTHWRPAAFNGFGTGGWWNFGGILREVYMRRVDTVDVEHVTALPRLKRVGGPARVELRTTLRNFTKKDRDVSLIISISGERFKIEPETVPALSPARGQRDVHHQAPAALGAALAGALQRVGHGGDQPRAARHLPALVRRAQDRDSARRDHRAERQAAEPQGRQRARGRRPGGRSALTAHAHAAHQPAEEPRRHDHALALPAPPRLHRGARPRGDHVLGRRTGLPGAHVRTGTSRAFESSRCVRPSSRFGTTSTTRRSSRGRSPTSRPRQDRTSASTDRAS